MKAYLASLSKVDEKEFRSWPREEQMAFLINAYNAFTVEKILTRYPDIGSIWDFGKVFGNPFKDEFFTLLGRKMSLDAIEHGTLRKSYREPRVHYALNCASVGCPMLREEAYVAARLERQLEEQAVRFLSDRSRNRFRDGRLEVSKIFDWFKEDFEPRAGVFRALCRRARLSRRRGAAFVPGLRLVAERLSIVIPALNEAAGIRAALEALAPLRAPRPRGDRRRRRQRRRARASSPRGLCDRVVVAPRGRRAQMNAGAREAQGRRARFPARRYPPAVRMPMNLCRVSFGAGSTCRSRDVIRC